MGRGEEERGGGIGATRMFFYICTKLSERKFILKICKNKRKHRDLVPCLWSNDLKKDAKIITEESKSLVMGQLGNCIERMKLGTLLGSTHKKSLLKMDQRCKCKS